MNQANLDETLPAVSNTLSLDRIYSDLFLVSSQLKRSKNLPNNTIK